jgi:hypothetical protein
MGNRPTQRAIQGLQLQIAEHRQKIAEELAKDDPNEGAILHWEKELQAFIGRLERLESRLSRKRRRGRSRL